MIIIFLLVEKRNDHLLLVIRDDAKEDRTYGCSTHKWHEHHGHRPLGGPAVRQLYHVRHPVLQKPTDVEKGSLLFAVSQHHISFIWLLFLF